MQENNIENNENNENIDENEIINNENDAENDFEENQEEEFENQQVIACPQCEKTYKEAEEIRLRSLAEMENYKKRLKKEKDEQVAYAANTVLAELLPSHDNLDLALQYGSKDEACQNTLMGVEMTRKLLLDVVKKHGLEVIDNAGEAFNPELHEAIAQEESTEVAEGHIIKVLQKGYMLKERLLRPAKVCVCKKTANFNATV